MDEKKWEPSGIAKKRSPLKTIGIVILVLFVLSTISRACGRKDTALDQKQTSAATEESATEQGEAQSKVYPVSRTLNFGVLHFLDSFKSRTRVVDTLTMGCLQQSCQ